MSKLSEDLWADFSKDHPELWSEQSEGADQQLLDQLSDYTRGYAAGYQECLDDSHRLWDMPLSLTKPHVEHYQFRGGIEPIDFVVSNKYSFLEGNAVKYIHRWTQKGQLDDLLKAKNYLDWMIETARANQS
jgi:hypothetical protein